MKLTQYKPENVIQPGPATLTISQDDGARWYNGGYMLNLLAEAHEHYQAQVQAGAQSQPDGDAAMPVVAVLAPGSGCTTADPDTMRLWIDDRRGAPVVKLVRQSDAQAAMKRGDAAMPVVGYEWQYVGKDEYVRDSWPNGVCVRGIDEMDPSKPPYEDMWRPIGPVVRQSDAQAAMKRGDAAMSVDCWRTPEGSAWSHEQGAHGRGTACTVALVTLADAQAAQAAEREHAAKLRETFLRMQQAHTAALAAKDAEIGLTRFERDTEKSLREAHDRLKAIRTEWAAEVAADSPAPAQRDTAAMLAEHMATVRKVMWRYVPTEALDVEVQAAFADIEASAKRMLGIAS